MLDQAKELARRGHLRPLKNLILSIQPGTEVMTTNEPPTNPLGLILHLDESVIDQQIGQRESELAALKELKRVVRVRDGKEEPPTEQTSKTMSSPMLAQRMKSAIEANNGVIHIDDLAGQIGAPVDRIRRKCEHQRSKFHIDENDHVTHLEIDYVEADG